MRFSEDEKNQPRPSWFYTQSGVIPFRIRKGAVEVLLVTSRKKNHWIIPKGIVEPGLSSADSALKEAYEEAGIKGRLHPGPLGSYRIAKWGGECTVEVFLMQVDELCPCWPEAQLRSRRWLPIHEAAGLVRAPFLTDCLARLPEILQQRGLMETAP